MRHNAAGLTLVELMITVAIISIVAALAIAKFSGRDEASRFIEDAAHRIRERRAAAIQLNAQTAPTLLQNYAQPDVRIDFADLETTRSLRIDGTDLNRDGIDDQTGLPLTRFVPPPLTSSEGGTWSYAYQGSRLTVPRGWRIITTARDLSPIPLIPLGIPVTAIDFTPDGTVSNPPPIDEGSVDPNLESPFPTIYVTNGRDAWAVAVHVAGPEIWRWDENQNEWRGFNNRTLERGTVGGTLDEGGTK